MKSHKKDFFSTVEIFNKISGLWLEPETSVIWKRMLHVIYNTFLVLYAMLYFISEVLVISHIMQEVKTLVNHIAMITNHAVSLLEVIVLITNQSKIADMKKTLQDESISYDDCAVSNELIRRSKLFNDRVAIATYFLYWMIGVSAHMSALKVLNADMPGMYFEQNSTCYEFLPHLFLIPFNTDTIRRCKDALIGMDFGMFIFAGYIATHDTMLFSLVSCIKAKLDILSEATRTMRERTSIRINLPAGRGLISDGEIPEFEMEMYFEIKRSNQILMILISASEGVEEIFNITLLARTLSSLLVIASCLFVSSTMEFGDPEMYPLIEYSCGGFFQLYMICYFGIFVTEASEEYRDSLYELDWYSSSRRFKQCVVIMMERMGRPLYISVGKFSPLTMETFVNVSYFA
nr:unnamed protein product [Callosobruchus chinensis]